MNNAFRVPLRASGGMPEYRQQTAGPEAGANVSARLDDSAARIVSAQATRNAQMDAQNWEQFNRGLQTFLKSGNRLYNEYRDKTSRAYVDEALLQAREEMEAWRTDYDKTHKGQNGLQAAADYQAQWAQISESHLKGLREKGVSGPYEQLATLHLRENGVHYDNQGAQFQQRQDKAWNTSIFEGKKDELGRAVQNDPDNAAWHGFLKAGVLEAYKRLHPGEDTSKLEHELDNLIATNRIDVKIAAKDFAGAAADVAAFSGGGHRGDRVAQFESSSHGVRAIGYDKNGGTSYGKYQLSSKQGSYQEWLAYLSQQGAEGAAIAGRLKSAGSFNTGSRSGAAVDVYRKEAEANPELFERTQREYIEKAHYGPMLAKLPAEERAMIEGNGGLQEMAWSVAVQHGGGGGAKLLARAWKPGMSKEQLVDAVYGIRGGYFGSSTQAVQDAVRSRFGRERTMIRGMLQQEGTPGGQGQSALTPQQRIAYSKAIETGEKKQSVDDFLTNTMNMNAPERLALLEQQYGNDPEKREVYDAIRQGIMYDATAKESMRNLEKRDRKLASLKEMEQAANLPPEQSYQKMMEIGQKLPLDERQDFYKAANNLRNPGYYDDPWAVQEITDRLANGEEVNVRAEYGSRITPKTAKRFTDQAFRTALPTIKNAFDDVANEWLAEEKNKNHAKELGVASKTGLWTRFLNMTDADEKKDYARLRQEAQDFFKKITLAKGSLFSSVDTIHGLVPGVMDKYSKVRPVQGDETTSPEYVAVKNYMQALGVKEEGWGGGYSREQLSEYYREYMFFQNRQNKPLLDRFMKAADIKPEGDDGGYTEKQYSAGYRAYKKQKGGK
ncbi:MAG: hypothetical protein K6F46_11650 [Desulfovibrio sp.]|nr:hypothetical protein [Desulfovibrio sp.]